MEAPDPLFGERVFGLRLPLYSSTVVISEQSGTKMFIDTGYYYTDSDGENYRYHVNEGILPNGMV